MYETLKMNLLMIKQKLPSYRNTESKSYEYLCEQDVFPDVNEDEGKHATLMRFNLTQEQMLT